MNHPAGHIYFQYAEPIGAGLKIFAVLAVALFIPYVIYLYRHYGRVDARRLWVSASFLLFLISAWALVLMPFPDLDSSICQIRHVNAQLVPFQWVSDTVRIAEKQGTGLAGLWRNPAFVVRVFNVLLLLPLGVYLRRWWRKGLPLTTLIAFGLSLAFEVTQWTGVWGLYRCAYRTFDVDDLIANTGGAVLGWFLAPLFVFIPTRRETDEQEHVDERITVPRRLIASFIDYVIAITVGGLAVGLANLITGSHESAFIAARLGLVTGLILVTVVLPRFMKRTPGQALLGMALCSPDGAPASWLRTIARAVFVWFPIVVLMSFGDVTAQATDSALSITMSLLTLGWIAYLIIATVRGGGAGPVDKWSGTTLRPRTAKELT